MWTCALQKIKIKSRCQALTWCFLSVCPDISVHLSVRAENFQQNCSFLTGEISSVVISDCIYHMPHLNADVFIGTTLIWNMLGLWKEKREREREKKRGENNLIPLTSYLTSNQPPGSWQTGTSSRGQKGMLRPAHEMQSITWQCCLSFIFRSCMVKTQRH